MQPHNNDADDDDKHEDDDNDNHDDGNDDNDPHADLEEKFQFLLMDLNDLPLQISKLFQIDATT